MKHPIPSAALAVALAFGAALPVVAQSAAPAPASSAGAKGATPGAGATVGATVYDTSNGVVGTIESVNGDVVMVSTGTHKVALGSSSFGAGAKGPVLAMTKAQLDAAAEAAEAAAAAALSAQLAVGATIYGSAGEKVGTVKEADAQFVTVTTAKGDAKLPRNAFAKGTAGAAIGMTAAQLEAAVTAATAQ